MFCFFVPVFLRNVFVADLNSHLRGFTGGAFFFTAASSAPADGDSASDVSGTEEALDSKSEPRSGFEARSGVASLVPTEP